jgi:methyltransferase (TIGR00027 family)
MSEQKKDGPNHTAVRVALWRALHVQVDSAPHVFEDEIGLRLADPGQDWRARPDMDPKFSLRPRASIVVRARFVEDLVGEQISKGLQQYVILGAGLDTFAQRRPEWMKRLHVFEIDEPATQDWKRERLQVLEIKIPPSLHFVPVDFEAGVSWRQALSKAGFHSEEPAVVASMGVSMYLTRAAISETLREAAALAPGSIFVMSFLRPPHLIVEDDARVLQEMTLKRAAASGTPFLSLFAPQEITEMAIQAGFKTAEPVSAEQLNMRYFAHRPDGLKTVSAEELIVART